MLRVPYAEVGSTKAYFDSVLDKSNESLLAGGHRPKLKYSADADILMLLLKDSFPVNASLEPGGVIVSYDETGEPVSVEFLNASKGQLIQPGETSLPIQNDQQ